MNGAKAIGIFRRDRSFKTLATLAVALFLIAGNPVRPGAENLVHTLDWVPYGRDAGFYAAVEKGFLKAEGLTVKIVRGKGSSETVKRLMVGDADFGTPDGGVVVISRSKGIKVKMIGAFHAKTPMQIVVVKGGSIRSIKDFEGKTLADASFSSTHKIFPALARKNGVDPAKVKWIFLNPASLASAGLAGRVDGWGAYATNNPSQMKAAKMAGKELLLFPFAENGVDIYSNTMSATEEKLAKHPGQVRRFMRGMYKGLAWAVKHPNEATDIILKKVPVLNRDTAIQHWQIAIDHLLTDAAKKHGIGYLSREKMTFTRDVVVGAHNLKTKPAVDDLYTTEFLPKVMVKR